MDGLEAIELNYKDIISTRNITQRIDSEYFKNEYIKGNRLLEDIGQTLCPAFVVKGGKRLPLNEDFSTSGIKYARAEDVKNLFLDVDNSPYISNKLHETLKRYITQKGDVLITIVGNSIGDVAKNELDDIINLTENCVRVFSKDDDLNTCLFAFLLSKYGQQQICRETVGTAQPKLSIERIKGFLVPKFSKEYSKLLSRIVHSSWNYINEGKASYSGAETVLYTSLNVKSHSTTTINTPMLFDSFYKTGRLDAEYYQPKYEQIEKELSTNETVTSLCNLFDSNYVPEKDLDYKYIELANIGNCGIISGVERIKGEDLPTRARRLVKEGQVIISSVEGSLDSCALITEEYDNALCSTGFYVIDSERINSETLLVLFKSEAIQALLKQRCSGTILAAISKDELLNMPLPEIDDNIQKEIAAKVQESFALRKKSKDLLEYAKQAVEMAIEQGEETATEWLNSNVTL